MGVRESRDITFYEGTAPMVPDQGSAVEVRREEVRGASAPRLMPPNLLPVPASTPAPAPVPEPEMDRRAPKDYRDDSPFVYPVATILERLDHRTRRPKTTCPRAPFQRIYAATKATSYDRSSSRRERSGLCRG
jgi:hypothetical protein